MSAAAGARLRLETPEGIAFSLPLAGPAARMLAVALDTVVIYSAIAVFALVPRALARATGGLSLVPVVLLVFLAPIAYAMVLEWYWRGQTVGKRLLRLRVLDRRGLPLAPWQVVVRNLARIVDFLLPFYTVGGLACLASRHRQRLGDRLAGTVVVREKTETRADLAALEPEKFNSFWAYPQMLVRLRLAAQPREAYLALEALLRRERLQPAARAEIFARLVEHFQRRVPFPAELRETLSDEHYLRNVIAVLFANRMER